MKIIGIDPGLSGAIAILENNLVLNIFDMPVMSEGEKNKRQLNSALLVNLIKENKSDHTIIYPNCKKPYYYLANNNNEIAFRVTPLSNLKEIMEMIDKPLISTSANISGEPFAKSFDKISSDLLNSVDVILNFEVESTGNPSSIIKINNGQIEYLRR